MKFYNSAESVAEKILDQFQNGDVPAAVANVFITRKDDLPCRNWSMLNQIITFMSGTVDARGFKQWEEVGRKVVKGSKAFRILGPCLKKVTVNDEVSGEEVEKMITVGFKGIPVHPIENTEIFDAEKWEKAQKASEEAAEEEKAFFAQLPLAEVAKAWGLKLETFNGPTSRCLGFYQHGEKIALGVQNLSTWAHELVHAADDKAGNITKGGLGQKADNEAVAELGGAVLLTILGYDRESDLGGAYRYIAGYAKGEKQEAIKLCLSVLNRVCEAVSLILDEAEKLEVLDRAA